MTKKLFVLLLALSVMSGCAMLGSKGTNTLVGTWTGEFPDMGEMTIVFNEDMTMKGSIGGMFEFTGKYVVDYSANPMTVDEIVLDNPQMGPSVRRVAQRQLLPRRARMRRLPRAVSARCCGARDQPLSRVCVRLRRYPFGA